MIYFITDANVFWPDPYLKGEDWTLIREFVRRNHGMLVVPQVVLDETVNNVKKQITDEINSVSRANRRISKLTAEQYVATTPNIDVEKVIHDYEHRFKSILNTLHAKILPYPKISHSDLVKRALQRRKPFNESGSGYRDSLIWISIIEHSPVNQFEHVLITQNSSDFSSGKDKKSILHPHLEAEWGESGYKQPLHLQSKLSEFVDAFVKPVLQRVENLKADLKNGTPINLAEYLESQFEAVFEGINSKVQLYRRGGVLEEPFGISDLVERPRTIQVEDVLEIKEKEVYIEFTAEYEATALAYVFRSSAASLNDLSEFQVSDGDWNEHYVEVEGTVILEVTLAMTYDIGSNIVRSFEVRSAEEMPQD